jgi:tetratricopeptide (TPR) repeat protein
MSKIIQTFLVVFMLASCGVKKVSKETRILVSKMEQKHIQTFHEGLRLKTSGRSEEAIAKFEACLELRQDQDAVYYALSQLELERDQVEKAAEYIKKAAAIDPENTWYIQELAYMYFERSDYSNALVRFEQLLDIEPQNVDWLYGYAEVLVKSGRKKEAIQALNRMENRIGKFSQFALQRYDLYMKMKDEQSAEQELLRAKTNFPKDANVIAYLVDHYFKTKNTEKGVSMLKELVVADPDNGRAHLALADIYQQRGNMEKANEELKAAFRSISLDVKTKVNIMNSVRESSFKIDEVMYELLDILVTTHPNDALVFMTQGDYLLAAKDEAGALDAYRKSLELDPSEYAVWNQVLLMEYQEGEFDELYAHSKECKELFPTMPTVFLIHGVSSNQLKKYDEATESLSYGMELVGNDRALKAEFLGQLAEAQFGTKNIMEGIENYKKAIQLDAQSLLLKNNFAAALAEVGKSLDLAASLSKQTIEQSPENGLYHDTYGLILFKKGSFEKAKNSFERALELEKDDPYITEHLGDVYYMLGEEAAALLHWEKALEMGSENTVLDQKIKDKKYYEPID